MDEVRVGHGFDAHRFASTDDADLVLAGATIPGGPPLAGHSDADVATHAVMDALLGAAGLGDLGEWFGTDDPALAGARSTRLLDSVVGELRDGGWQIGNVDVTIVAEKPRLAAHQPVMRERLAATLRTDIARVSVKVTSTDQMGSIGQGEGMAAHAAVLIRRSPVPSTQLG